MAKKSVKTTQKTSVKDVSNDPWSSIETGAVRSAHQEHYKMLDEKSPKVKHYEKMKNKRKRICDGNAASRFGKTDSIQEKKKKVLEETFEEISTQNRQIAVVNLNGKEHSNKKYIFEQPEEEIEEIVTNGYVDKHAIIEDDMEGLDSVDDEDDGEDIELFEYGDDSDDVEDEESDLSEMLDEEEENEIDEEEVRMNPDHIGQIIDACCGFSANEDEDDDEQYGEDGDSLDDSSIDEQDASSDDECFVGGHHRETKVIKSTTKKARKNKTTKEAPPEIDFDTFPFTDNDSVVTATRAFSYIVKSCDVQTFFEQFYQKTTLVVKRSSPNYYGNLFSTKQLVKIFEQHHVEYTTNVNVADYNDGVRKTMNGEGRVYAHEIKQHISLKRSVQLVNPQSFDDRIWYLCEVLQELFGCFVGANTYLTPAASSGFAPHYDEIDAFLLQVEGKKYWRVWAPESVEDELPLESSGNFTEKEMSGRKPCYEGWIEAGDLLYIPRGFIHQARASDEEHSLHVTVSTGRHWSYANLLDKLVPEALEAFANSRMKLRKGLPIGLFDMSGVADVKYPLEENFDEKFKFDMDRHLSMFRNFVSDSLLESSVDLIAKEFFKQALPPKLTQEELSLSVVGIDVDILDNDLVEFNAKTRIRLLRKHTQRLCFESEDKCFVAHRFSNSRVFEGRPPQLVDFPVEAADVYVLLTNAYPEWRSMEKVLNSKKLKNTPRKVILAAVQNLFKIGVLLVKN